VRIGFLHTSAVHTETFEQLVHHADATVETVTIVDESLLEDARVRGPQSDQVRAGINRAVDRLVDSGVRTIVCTCSTISGQAELAGKERSIDVMRVDRPLAEAAVAAGRRISVLVALESTVGPTTALIAEVAATRNTDVDITVRLCEGAWPCFEAGDLESYLAIVAAECDAVAETSDVIVLAQASMAGASRRCTTQVPVISSPQLAVDAALSVGRSLSDGRS
jgi:glutamate racemase